MPMRIAVRPMQMARMVIRLGMRMRIGTGLKRRGFGSWSGSKGENRPSMVILGGVLTLARPYVTHETADWLIRPERLLFGLAREVGDNGFAAHRRLADSGHGYRPGGQIDV